MAELLRRIGSSEITEWGALFHLEAEELDRASKRDEDQEEPAEQVMRS